MKIDIFHNFFSKYYQKADKLCIKERLTGHYSSLPNRIFAVEARLLKKSLIKT